MVNKKVKTGGEEAEGEEPEEETGKKGKVGIILEWLKSKNDMKKSKQCF